MIEHNASSRAQQIVKAVTSDIAMVEGRVEKLEEQVVIKLGILEACAEVVTVQEDSEEDSSSGGETCSEEDSDEDVGEDVYEDADEDDEKMVH